MFHTNMIYVMRSNMNTKLSKLFQSLRSLKALSQFDIDS